MFMQLMARFKLFRIDMNEPEERSLYESARKNLSMVISVVQAVVFVQLGMFGATA